MEAINCPTCNGAGFLRSEVPVGHPEFGRVIHCENPIHLPDTLNRLATLANLSQADLSRRLVDIRPNKDNKAALEAARKMIDDPYGWLYLWGGPGNGKSEMLIAVVNEVNLAGKGPAMYVTFTRLLDWIRESFQEGSESYSRRLQRVLDVKLLAIDEMDKARSTEFADEFRFSFLDERYRQATQGSTAIVFAGNAPPNELPLPLYDRVRDGRFSIVKNAAASARASMSRSPLPQFAAV